MSHLFLPHGEGQAVRGFRTPQVPVSLLIHHGPPLRLYPRQAANLVSSSDTGVRQRTRVARPKAEGEWNPLYETGERIPLDRGHGPSSGVLRPLCFTGVAPDTEPVCPEGESPHGRPSRIAAVNSLQPSALSDQPSSDMAFVADS